MFANECFNLFLFFMSQMRWELSVTLLMFESSADVWAAEGLLERKLCLEIFSLECFLLMKRS